MKCRKRKEDSYELSVIFYCAVLSMQFFSFPPYTELQYSGMSLLLEIGYPDKEIKVF